MKASWKRVNRERPCPICERPDWCLIAPDGSAAICQRTESPKRCGDAGWLHRLAGGDWRRPRRYVRTLALPTSVTAGDIDFDKLAADSQAALNFNHLDKLACDLGLSVDSLMAFDIGWAANHSAWTFPMVDADGNVLGIKLRLLDGRKLAVKGSKEGLFIPRGQTTTDHDDGRLLICEGPTDAAALLDMELTNVIGRPSCLGGVKIVVELVRRRKTSAVVIVADGDEPGQRGADNLASVLVVYVPSVQVIVPPAGIKDARAWKQAGGTRADLEHAIQAAAVRRLKIRGA